MICRRLETSQSDDVTNSWGKLLDLEFCESTSMTLLTNVNYNFRTRHQYAKCLFKPHAVNLKTELKR